MDHGYAKTVKELPISRDKVFAMLADFGGLDQLMPGAISGCAVEGSGVGAKRKVTLSEASGSPGSLIERCDALVDNRFFAYSIVGDSPLPFENYVATVTLEDAGSGCRVTWESRWTAKAGQKAAEIQPVVEGLYGALIEGMETQLAKAA